MSYVSKYIPYYFAARKLKGVSLRTKGARKLEGGAKIRGSLVFADF